MSKKMDGTFAARLLLACNHQGVPYSQQGIADLLDLPDGRSRVDHWINKGVVPRAAIMFKLARKLGVDAYFEWFATGDGMPPPWLDAAAHNAIASVNEVTGQFKSGRMEKQKASKIKKA